MSLPPSPHSNNQHSPNNSRQDIHQFVETLWIRPDIESQLSSFSEGMESSFSCQARIWLTGPFLQLINDKEQYHHILVVTPSRLMDQAVNDKSTASIQQEALNPTDLPLAIALPLLIQKEPVGAVQLERSGQEGFTLAEIDLIQSITIQFSNSLNYFELINRANSLKEEINQRNFIEEISQSILSNLDRDSLINTIISLLHQSYGFNPVTIYTSYNGDKSVLKKTGMSQDGIELEKNYYFEQDPGPVGWCVSQNETVTINDTSLETKYGPDIFDKHAQSELILPLLQGDLFVGVLDLCAEAKDAFIPETVELLKFLADNIAVAIRNANLYRLEQLRRMVTERLHDVIGSLSIDISPDEILKQILDELDMFLIWETAAIWLKFSSPDDMDRQQSAAPFYLATLRVKDQSQKGLFETFLHDTSKASELFSNDPWMPDLVNGKIPMIRSITSSREPLGTLLGFDNRYSAIAAPLVNDNQVIGILVCIDKKADQYNAESLSIIDAFATYSAKSIENVRLYSAAHDQAWITTVMLQVIEATQSITDLDDSLATLVDILPGLLGVNACAIFLWDPSIDAFSSRALNGFSDEQAGRLNEWDISSGLIPAFEKIKVDRIPTIINSGTISTDDETEVFPEYNFAVDLMILFPLLTQNTLCGALLVDFSNSDLDLNSSQEKWDDKYSLIQGAAHQAAIAIENLQLIKSQEEEAYISVALLQVAQAVVSLNQLDEILETIVRITPILVGVKRCIIYIWDSKEQVYRQSESFGFSKSDLSGVGQVIKTNEFPFIEAIQRTNRIIYHSLRPDDSPTSWNEITADDNYVIQGIEPDSDQEIAIKLDERSLVNRQRLIIGFPLSVKSEILGVMLIEEEEPIRGLPSIHIQEKRIEIVKGITQQAAIAIKNELLQQEAVKSMRLERELQLAREIQATFLPDRLPELQGWDIDVRWQPARQVGGDFYDFLRIDEDRIGFVIADVADKGMPAALFMTLIRTLIRAAAKGKSSPAAVLSEVNELLLPDAKQGMFVTIFYCVIDVKTGSIVYANAGHNPPIVKRYHSVEMIELERTSIAIGLFTDIGAEEQALTLNPGDCIMLYTDGVTEAFSVKEEMFGKERLVDLLSNNEYDSSKELLDTVERAVNDFIQGTDLSDDMTMAVFYRKPI